MTVYSTKSIVVGSTKVEVRQPVFRGQDGVTDLVRAATLDARRCVNEAMRLCNPSGFMKDIRVGHIKPGIDEDEFQLLFKQWPTPQALSTVWSTLGLISAGLNAPFGIKVYTQGDSSTTGYVNKYFPPTRLVTHTGSDGRQRNAIGLSNISFKQCARTDGSIMRDARYGSALVGKGEIHVAFERLNSPMGAKTLIHEAGHKFANLADFSYMYDFEYANKAISTSDTLRNADSYAWLAFLRM